MYNDNRFLFDNFFTGGFAFLFLFILFLIVAFIVIAYIANWKLFKKAGKKGWECLIPFYSSYVLTEIAGLNWWWFLLMIASNIVSAVNDDLSSLGSLVSLFATFNCYYNIAKKFKKDTGVAVCAGIFSFIFAFIFAFSSKEKYYSEIEVSNNGVFPGSNVSTQNTTNNNVSNNMGSDNTNNYCIHCGAKIESNYKFCPKCGKENQ